MNPRELGQWLECPHGDDKAAPSCATLGLPCSTIERRLLARRSVVSMANGSRYAAQRQMTLDYLADIREAALISPSARELIDGLARAARIAERLGA